MNLTVDNFYKETGFRFRVSKDQAQQIEAGTLTREQAFREFLENGGLERLRSRAPEVPDSVYLDPELTLENFPDKVEAATGTRRRFRVSGDQKDRIDAGNLTREAAFNETVAAARRRIESQQIPVTNNEND